ncbi:MAG: hypothetical protein NC213_09115 [Acetobacter sp.]|nr:hypothetical protein [Bacteroides sp.]MCM1341889.1 hypothetical protein [Acetobacter sp.]MCM1433186.1 hypothetical protein [Clostridiales bacterium]
MKKFLLFVLAFILTLQCSFTCLAAVNPEIYSDELSLQVNELQLIPVNIKNNSGIMGFKMTVEYPSECLSIKSVTKGSVTSGGNFNHNLGLKDGKIDIVWNSIEDVKKDGSIFVLGVELEKEITDDIVIKLLFSQEDTFNEAWEDVTFDCKNIIISANYIEPTTQETTIQNGEAATKAPAPIDNSQIIDAVDTTLEQNGYENLKDVENTDDFIKDFNKNLETITGLDKHSVTDFDTIKSMYNSAYEGEFITETTNNIDYDKINLVVKETLDKFKVKSIDELDDNDKAKFVQKVEEKLKEQNPDTPNISKDLETDDALDIIEKLYNSTNTEEQNNESNDSNKTMIIIVISVVVLLGIVVIIMKKKKLSNKDSQ